MDIGAYEFQSVPVIPDIEVLPPALDFGELEVGISYTAILTVSNLGDGLLTVGALDFAEGSSEDFAVLSSLSWPLFLEAEEGIDIEVGYLPSSGGLSTATLQIASDDPDEPLVEVSLSGIGIELPTTPEEQIIEILDFFDVSVDEGSLEGSGPGKSAGGRLKALDNQIAAVSSLIAEGALDEAYSKLLSIYQRVDGQPKPPDFVSGEAAEELANLVLELMETLAGE